MEIGDDVVLPPHKRLLLQYPQDGDVDGDFGFLARVEAAALGLDQHNHAGGGQSWLEARNRLRQWSFAVWDMLCAMVPERLPTAGDIAGLLEQAESAPWSVAASLRGLGDLARGHVVSWQTAVAQKLSGWTEFAEIQQELWLILAGDMWVEWRHDTRLGWRLLLERLMTLMESLGLRPRAWSQVWLHMMRVVRTCCTLWCSWLAQRVLNVKRFLRSRSTWRDGMQGVRFSLISFGLSSLDAFMSCCQDLCQDDRDWHLAEDFLFLWEEPRVKALVVALLFAFAVLMEVVAASYLPVWCSSSLNPHALGIHDMMASATLSHSVLMSLKGAAAVI